MQTGFWNLTHGTAMPDNFQAGQVKIHGAKAKEICDELEEIVENCKRGTEDAQKKFLKTLG
jgi:UDP-N-acetylglucosamine 2-epimerase